MASVFEIGKFSVEVIVVTAKEKGDEAASSLPPKPVLILSPTNAGVYPVAVFLHGFLLQNRYYTQLLKHVASHGFIVVAPQLYTCILANSTEDVESAAAVANWLPDGLRPLLPRGVEPDLTKLALAGHSRGGHAAFAVALGLAKTPLEVKFSTLIGVDPVAGTSKSSQTPPKILTYEPSSFDLDIPVLVLGTGLGDEKKNILFPACAPKGVNHEEFYYECKPPCYHIVMKEYGHLDMLDDNAPKIIAKCPCKNGKNCRDIMRRTTGGLAVAFLKAYFEGEDGYLQAILEDPQQAPTVLDPVSRREAKNEMDSLVAFL
ncbi:chlorophyllase-2, chloroplastic-like [Ananas comosus]|uniref:chlorophyllase n=1 Tax=Ananas comosus TaxID=4615 RepID=A0A6P5F947_ANACO|nr:chlorophyllase-2, chloroplastic-like [Ananas comosus]